MISRVLGSGDWNGGAFEFSAYDFPAGGMYMITAEASFVTKGSGGGVSISVGLNGAGPSVRFCLLTGLHSSGEFTKEQGFSMGPFTDAELAGRRLKVTPLSDDPTVDEVMVNVYVARVKEEG